MAPEEGRSQKTGAKKEKGLFVACKKNDMGTKKAEKTTHL